MQVIVDNLAVNYDRKGSGPAVLLLHGWGDSYRTFAGLAAKLNRRFDVVALDLPGFGGSEAPKEAWDLDNYADFVNSFLAKIEAGKLYAIIGHSNGGALAIRGLANGKLRAEKLVLIAASGVRNTQKSKHLITKIIAKIGKLTTFWLPSATRQQLRRKLYGTIGSDALAVPQLQETYKKTVRQDVQADAAKLKLPVLLIYADKDPAIPLKDGKRYAGLIKNSRLEVLSSSDHFIHHDRAETVEELAEDFL